MEMKHVIKKAEGARSNTYRVEVKGLIAEMDTRQIKESNIGILFTSDKLGETISVYGLDGNQSITVPLEAVEQLIKHTRNQTERG
jgi:transaldolase